MKLEPKALMLGGALGVALLGGCSSGLDGVDKRLSAMQDEIAKVQNQNDRLVERLDAVELRQAKSEVAAKPSAPVVSSSERPSLKVVKVVPEDTSGMPSPQVGTVPANEAADDPSPRPVIKLRGGGGGKNDSKNKGEGES